MRQPEPAHVARHIRLRGPVQGLGVRPAICRTARNLGLTGSVQNARDGVTIDIEGAPESVQEFLRTLPNHLPCPPESINLDVAERQLANRDEFVIAPPSRSGPLEAPVPLDRAICDRCLQESHNHQRPRRHAYPFVSCAQCGPRYSILQRMPYERTQTALQPFPLCSECQSEFESPADRRFHAETTSCAICGPKVWINDRAGRNIAGPWREILARSLEKGEILAIRGVGGYQLLCDATNKRAIARLRDRKHRPVKPFAVLVEHIEAARKIAVISEAEAATLQSPVNPILLLRARPDSSVIARLVHPGLADIGVMLPATALHAILARDFARPIVCTSGNLEGETIEHDPNNAQRRLASIADIFLHHDRKIVRPIDDSVIRYIHDRPVTLRLARGLAPLALNPIESRSPTIAMGGHQKSAIAWYNGCQAVLGPHIGDLDTVSNQERFRADIQSCQTLYGFQPRHVFCDAHPDYASTRAANTLHPQPLSIQHHHAHVAAAMLEANITERQVLGLAWDGTGLGPDSSIWGGECLLANSQDFRRVATFRPFQLPGGHVAIREPDRIAIAMVLAADSDAPDRWQSLLPPSRVRQVRQLLRLSTFAPWTSSVGRIFDAVAWILLADDIVGFDGRPAILLEALAQTATQATFETYPIPIQTRPSPKERSHDHSTLHVFDWRPMLRKILDERLSGTDPAAIANRFHNTLATAAVQYAGRWPRIPVVLSGGVFQNRHLVQQLVNRWDEGFGQDNRIARLHLPGVIPPNDGGLAAGQLAIGLARINASRPHP